jgi:hypothetical protein
MVFEDQGFGSGGAGKGTGFSEKDIIFNIYCPKGTKMAYMNTKGQFASSKYENEMILQRGYSFKITKAYKGYDDGGNLKTFIDCDLILGSDKNKWDDETLAYLQQNNFKFH